MPLPAGRPRRHSLSSPALLLKTLTLPLTSPDPREFPRLPCSLLSLGAGAAQSIRACPPLVPPLLILSTVVVSFMSPDLAHTPGPVSRTSGRLQLPGRHQWPAVHQTPRLRLSRLTAVLLLHLPPASSVTGFPSLPGLRLDVACDPFLHSYTSHLSDSVRPSSHVIRLCHFLLVATILVQTLSLTFVISVTPNLSPLH